MCFSNEKEKKELRAKPTNAYSRAGKMLHMLLFTAQKPNMIKFVRNSFLQSPFWRKRRKKMLRNVLLFQRNASLNAVRSKEQHSTLYLPSAWYSLNEPLWNPFRMCVGNAWSEIAICLAGDSFVWELSCCQSATDFCMGFSADFERSISHSLKKENQSH